MLTSGQYQSLKTAILSDSALSSMVSANDDEGIASYLNVEASPTVEVWRPNISIEEIKAALVYSEVAALTPALQGTLQTLLQGAYVDATQANIRSAFSTIFSPGATRTALTALAKRNASRFEAIFTTSGVCQVFGQKATALDVGSALRNY